MGATMNDKSINSLISAYHDGELNAAERTEVDQLLATSPEARAELDAFRRMSNLLQEAGRPTLQTDLTPFVMQTIEQQMPRKTASRSASPAKWTRWVAVAAVAAGLIVAVSLARQAPPQAPAVANIPKPDQNNSNANANNAIANAVTPKAQDKTQNNDVIAANETKATSSDVVPLDPSDLPLDVIRDLKRAKSGQIVRFLKNSGKDVAVFHLMVLDTKPGLESLQMILSAQQISGPTGQVGQSGVMAVYVEANQDQMDRVIAELQSKDQEQFIALAVQQPMKSEEVQKVVKKQSTDVASQQVPVKQDELRSLGVNPVQEEQIAVAGKNRGRNAPVQESMNGNQKPTRKVLIVLEKVPTSLLPK